MFFIIFHASGLHFCKKETLAQAFSCEFCEICKNTFFAKHFRATASGYSLKPGSGPFVLNLKVAALSYTK